MESLFAKQQNAYFVQVIVYFYFLGIDRLKLKRIIVVFFLKKKISSLRYIGFFMQIQDVGSKTNCGTQTNCGTPSASEA